MKHWPTATGNCRKRSNAPAACSSRKAIWSCCATSRARSLLPTPPIASWPSGRKARWSAVSSPSMCLNRARPRCWPMAQRSTTRRSRALSGLDGSRGVKAWFDRMPASRPRCDASAATLPIVQRPHAQTRKVEIAAFVDERLPMEVVGDAARLRQVLLNLAGNAIKFTESGGVALIVEPGIWPNEISFLMRDTGIGIAAEAQERIFREFEQADERIGRNYGGTGLGLSISERIVKRMGGRITLESEPGVGSTFEVSVPLAASGAEP